MSDSISNGFPFPMQCGCTAEFIGVFEGYGPPDGHTCDGTVLAQQSEARIDLAVQLAEEAEERQKLPLNGNHGFRLMR